MKQTWLSDVWKLTIPPKIKMFLCKLKHEAIPLNARLHAGQIIPSPKCTFCEEDETILHHFFQCPFAKQVWKDMPFSSNPLDGPVESIRAGLHLIMKASPLPPTGVSTTHLGALVLWVIWISRNQKIFQDRIFTSHESTLKALINAKEWQEAQRSETIVRQSQLPLPSDYPIDANDYRSDAAWKTRIPTAGIAWSFYREKDRSFHHTVNQFLM